jgi:raffinose/stachyose/melibiose transport system substrate-binding protein
MMKKVMPIVFCILIMGLFFSACKGRKADSSGETILNFIHFRSEDAATYEKINKIFEERNPGIKINMDVRTANQEDYYTILKTRMSGRNDSIDLLGVQTSAYLEEFVSAGLLVDMTDKPVTSFYAPDMVDAGKSGDGRVYAIPQSFNAYLIFYNKKIFAEYDLTPPKSWSDMRNIIRVLRQNGQETIAAGFGESWVFDLQTCPLFSSYFPDNPEKILLDIQEQKVKWNDPRVRSVYQDIQQMGKEGFFINGAEGTNYEPSLSLFAQEKAAMLNTGSWSIGTMLAENKNLDFDFFVLPNSQDKLVMTTDIGMSIAINAGSNKQEAAMRYFGFLSSKEAAAIYAEDTIQFSTVKDVNPKLPQLAAVNALLSQYKSYRSCSAFPTDAKFLVLYNTIASRAFLGEDIDALMIEAQAITDNLDSNQ